jgi:hypothetical protein
MKLLLILILITFCASSCVSQSENNVYKTKTGKRIIIEESHPAGQSLSTIVIKSLDFEHNMNETNTDTDPIKDVFVTDLDENGFDEIYIITVSAGSGSYGNVIGFASNNDKSLSMINFPEIQQGDIHFKGYMGHDQISIESNYLLRTFPIYLDEDTNTKAAGGKRILRYSLQPGEAMWQLKVVSSKDIE